MYIIGSELLSRTRARNHGRCRRERQQETNKRLRAHDFPFSSGKLPYMRDRGPLRRRREAWAAMSRVYRADFVPSSSVQIVIVHSLQETGTTRLDPPDWRSKLVGPYASPRNERKE